MHSWMCAHLFMYFCWYITGSCVRVVVRCNRIYALYSLQYQRQMPHQFLHMHFKCNVSRTFVHHPIDYFNVYVNV